MKIGKEGDEPANDGRIGVGVEAAVALSQFCNQPDTGGTSCDAVGWRTLGRGERRDSASAFDDSGQTLMSVGVMEKALHQRMLVSVQMYVNERAGELCP